MRELEKKIHALMRRAGEMVRRAHDVEEGGGVTEKQGDAANLVTRYDTAVQEMLMTELSRLCPGAEFLAEEKENDAAVLSAGHCFVIDPIDGTTNFIHGYRRSAISLAMLTQGEPTLAAVYDPYMDELFTARRGGGAFCNGSPIAVASRPPSHGLVVFGTAPYVKERRGEETFALAKELFYKTRDLRRSGAAALDLAALAAGRCDMFFEMILAPWDYAAGHLLITEAGGRISDMDGNPLTFRGMPPVIAASPACYDFLLETVKHHHILP